MERHGTIQAGQNSPLPSWRDAYEAINGGAFAVLLSAAIFGAWVWKVASKPLAKYLESEAETKKKLQETIASNSETLKTMAQNNSEVSATLKQIAERQDRVEDNLSAMQAEIPAYEYRQKQQLQYLREIAEKMKLPLPVHMED